MNFVTSVFKKYINKNDNRQEQQEEKTKDIIGESSNVLKEAHAIPPQSSKEYQNAGSSNDEEESFEDAEINPTKSGDFFTKMADDNVGCFLQTTNLPYANVVVCTAKPPEQNTMISVESLNENCPPPAFVHTTEETLNQKEFTNINANITETNSLNTSSEFKILPLTHEYSGLTALDPVSPETGENEEQCRSHQSLESNETKLVSLSDILVDSPVSRDSANLNTVDLKPEMKPILKEQGALETLIQNVNESLAINNPMIQEDVPKSVELEKVDAIMVSKDEEQAMENHTRKCTEIDECVEKSKSEEECLEDDKETKPEISFDIANIEILTHNSEIEKSRHELSEELDQKTVEHLNSKFLVETINIEKKDEEFNRKRCEDSANKPELTNNKSNIEIKHETTAHLELTLEDTEQKHEDILERQDTQEFEILEQEIKESVETGLSNIQNSLPITDSITFPLKSENCQAQNLNPNSLAMEETSKENNNNGILYERQETNEFEELEKAICDEKANQTKYNMEVILDQLESDNNSPTDQPQNKQDARNFEDMEEHVLIKETNENEMESQFNRTFVRQDTQEFENLEKQCSKEECQKVTDDILEELVDAQSTRDKPVEEIKDNVVQEENESSPNEQDADDAREAKPNTALNEFLEGLLTNSDRKETKSKNEKTQANKNIKQLQSQKSLEDIQSISLPVNPSAKKSKEASTNVEFRADVENKHSASRNEENRYNITKTKQTSSIQDKYKNEDLKNKVNLVQNQLDSIEKENIRINQSDLNKQADKNVIQQYKNLLIEYEKRIEQQNKDLENLRMESDRSAREFTSAEMAFSDLYEKYQKTKSIIATYGRNEDILLENIQNMEEQLFQVETKCLMMKEQSIEQIMRACERVEQEKKQFKQEITKLEAQVKRLEIKALSLELQLKQKNEECRALSSLCDDITGRKGTLK